MTTITATVDESATLMIVEMQSCTLYLTRDEAIALLNAIQGQISHMAVKLTADDVQAGAWKLQALATANAVVPVDVVPKIP